MPLEAAASALNCVPPETAYKVVSRGTSSQTGDNAELGPGEGAKPKDFEPDQLKAQAVLRRRALQGDNAELGPGRGAKPKDLKPDQLKAQSVLHRRVL